MRTVSPPLWARVAHNGTWVTGPGYRAFVDCQDGKRRLVLLGRCDTFFSMVALAKFKGKRVRGFVTGSVEEGYTFTADRVQPKKYR